MILAAIDFSAVTGRVVDMAVRMAKATGTSLALVHVAAPEPEFIGYDPGPQSVRDAIAHKLHDQHRALGDLCKKVEDQGVRSTSLLVQGYPVEKILLEAGRLGADMIVIGSHGHGMLRHLLVGSVTDGVLRKAPCPVLVVPAHAAAG